MATSEEAELRDIVAQLARCHVGSESYLHPMYAPDDVDQWQLILRARHLAGIAPSATEDDAEEPPREATDGSPQA